MLKALLRTTTAKITAVLFAAVIATGGLAAASALAPSHNASPAALAARLDAHVSGTVSDEPTSTVTGTDDDHEAVTATVHEHDGDATATVTATAHEADVSETETDANHGHCVSFAAHNAAAAGLSGAQIGAFVSTVASDASAVSAKVTAGKPDAACVAAMMSAETAALATPVTGTASDSADEQKGGPHHGSGASASSGAGRHG